MLFVSSGKILSSTSASKAWITSSRRKLSPALLIVKSYGIRLSRQCIGKAGSLFATFRRRPILLEIEEIFGSPTAVTNVTSNDKSVIKKRKSVLKNLTYTYEILVFRHLNFMYRGAS